MPRFIIRNKKPMDNDQDQALQAEEQNEAEITTLEEPASGVCQECDGSGLADKKEMGNMASKLCQACDGSGRI